MKIYLHPKDNVSYLTPEEIAEKISGSFPSPIVDWKAADLWTLNKLKYLISIGAPEVIQLSHTSLFGNMAYVKIFLQKLPNQFVEFFISTNESVILQTNNETLFPFLVDIGENLSKVLGYEFRVDNSPANEEWKKFI